MINSIPLALLSVVPVCTGAPLASRLEEILQWLREGQQSNRLDTTSGQGSTEWQTTVSVTTDSWSTTVSENTTTTTTTTIPTVQFSDASMISLIFILIFAAIALFCTIGFVGLKILRRNRKSTREADEEEGTEQEPVDNDRFYPCHFLLPELVQERNRYQGFVTLNDRGQVIDVKQHWTFEQLDEYFRGKCSFKVGKDAPWRRGKIFHGEQIILKDYQCEKLLLKYVSVQFKKKIRLNIICFSFNLVAKSLD